MTASTEYQKFHPNLQNTKVESLFMLFLPLNYFTETQFSLHESSQMFQAEALQ